MPHAEFEEKQYEIPANIELGIQHAAVFAAGQVLEAIVGYDVASLQPAHAPIWQLLGVNVPTGLQLVPNLWQRAAAQPKPADLPANYVSLVLQYKRPQFLSRATALQWPHWQQAFFRFAVLPHQQDILASIQNSTLGRATVRYSCPSFWRYAELQAHQWNRAVLENSTFVSPRRLINHHVWTYTTPGTSGYANPRPEDVPTEKFRGIWNKAMKRASSRREKLIQHLRGLAVGVEIPVVSANTSPEWLGQFTNANQLTPVQEQAVFDTVEFARRCGEAGASWFVADL